MQMNKILTLLALTAISIFNALAVAPYQKAVNNFVSDPMLKHASIGVCVMDLETGEILADADAEKTFVTASTMKIITSASALEILGKDFHFHTMVYAVGKIDGEGTLHGNLIIQGGGGPDPRFSPFQRAPCICRFACSGDKRSRNTAHQRQNHSRQVDHCMLPRITILDARRHSCQLWDRISCHQFCRQPDEGLFHAKFQRTIFSLHDSRHALD